jgi:hypothetical protein
VELEQVVGGHAEPPFGHDGGSSAAMESGDTAVVFGVAEPGLDDVLSLWVERLAVLGGADVAHEVVDPAAPARHGRCSQAGSGPDQDGDAVAGEPLDLLGVPVARVGRQPRAASASTARASSMTSRARRS